MIYDWIFATNLSGLKAYNYVMLYKKRWGIETSYRMFKDVRTHTYHKHESCSEAFFVSCNSYNLYIYNLWKFYNLLVKVEVTFKGFVFSLFLSCLDVEHIQFCKKRMKEVFTSIPDLKEIA